MLRTALLTLFLQTQLIGLTLLHGAMLSLAKEGNADQEEKDELFHIEWFMRRYIARLAFTFIRQWVFRNEIPHLAFKDL